MNDQPRPRPALLRALGHSDPPEEVQIEGLTWKLEEVFKHDSWAATGLYEREDRKVVVKFNRQESVFFFPMAWLGHWLAKREARAYERLKDVSGVPPACGVVRVKGRTWFNAFAHDYVEGHPLAQAERPGHEFFEALDDLIRIMHERGLAYLDLNKRENVIVTDKNHPLLVDFQIHLAPPFWLAGLPPVRWIMRQFQKGDVYHLRKLQIYHTLGPDAVTALRIPWSSRIWRLIYVHPVQWARRRLLVALGIRQGDGLAMSELVPEKAVRLTRERQSRTTGPETDAAKGSENKDPTVGFEITRQFQIGSKRIPDAETGRSGVPAGHGAGKIHPVCGTPGK